jgi:hypothetical protein
LSHLSSILRQITKKSFHPNSLIYDVQLARAKQKHLLTDQLGDGIEIVVALGEPEKVESKQNQEPETSAREIQRVNKSESAGRDGDGVIGEKSKRMEADQRNE